MNQETTKREFPENQPEKVKEYASFDDFSMNAKVEGLRPRREYVGGDPDEIVIVEGRKYKKVVKYNTDIDITGQSIPKRPATEQEYYSHACPGWDYGSDYMGKMGVDSLDSRDLSDLVLYELEEIES